MCEHRFAATVFSFLVVYGPNAPAERNGISQGDPSPEFCILSYARAQYKTPDFIEYLSAYGDS
jgi:hypothetical protein